MNFAGPFLAKLYTLGSLENTDAGARFELKNRLMDAQLVGVKRIAIDGNAVPLEQIHLELESGTTVKPDEVDAARPVPFPLRAVLKVHTEAAVLQQGKHEIAIAFDTRPFGTLEFKVEDTVPA